MKNVFVTKVLSNKLFSFLDYIEFLKCFFYLCLKFIELKHIVNYFCRILLWKRNNMASKRRLSGSLLPQQTGTDGIDGHDGTDGIDGHDGTDGIDGHDGTDGIDGHDGTDGIDGHDGTDGIDGIETQSDGSSNSNVCLVCGDKARFINYGALACQSCKTFFRRNGFRPQVCV